MRKFSLIFLLFFQTYLKATEFSPWFGRVLEVETRADCLLQTYQQVDTIHGNDHRPACDLFLEAGASLAYSEDTAFELEVVMAATRHRTFGIDSLFLTGRKRWLNDIVGDPISLAGGLTFSKVFKTARHDIATFHHGGIQCEGHISAGREFSYKEFWINRIWGVAGFGVADLGSPWIIANFFWEHNCWDLHQVQFFMRTLWGLGTHGLNLKKSFNGYGPIKHQSIDLGVRYSIQFESQLRLDMEYGYRVFAANCPKQVNLILVELFYPFKL